MKKIILISLLAVLLISCQEYSILLIQKGKCVRLDDEWAYFEIPYNCNRAHPCTKIAKSANTGKFEINKTYTLKEIAK